ncbi:hypothetical protein [Lentzea nigeriaca]|uniref:hypothetical protein n=1 Tax=Lentzea nigeriaca TaxID=1128665 RepID=UPI0019578F83|nr:hypothetical protein [Lentzea nigeriaca]MBM7864274.1 hypothetical protein [Lentzea nigeriaca]
MTGVHRPLSAWISYVDNGVLSQVNDGEDRADARAFSRFAAGWTREALRWNEMHVLALSNGESTAVELDDYGRPVQATPDVVDAVARVERGWPHVSPDLDDFRDAALPLRYWLMQRLADEGTPEDGAFSILPWDLLDRAVESLLGTLRGDGVGELVEMRHWLTPAVRGLTGPLEQLDHGLRTEDESVARLGAAGLLESLLHLSLSRIPSASLSGLGSLVREIGAADPLLRHTARVVGARLTGESGPRMRIRLNSVLEAAANGREVREHSASAADGEFSIRVNENQAGEVRVLLRLPKPVQGRFGPWGDVFARLRVVRQGAEEQFYWVNLQPEDGQLVGFLKFPLRPGWSDFDCDGVPVTVDDMAGEHPERLLGSLYASTSSVKRWSRIANTLPDLHPIRLAVRQYEESR